MPGWIGATIALSLVAIAAGFAVMAVAVVVYGKRVERQAERAAQDLAELRAELGPTMDGLRRLAADGQDLAAKIRTEVLAAVRTSRRVRRSVSRGVRQDRHRLAALDALYEVVHDEVEDTALHVAATLRSVRGGAGALARIRRLLVRGRK
jgi:hypothetical protein